MSENKKISFRNLLCHIVNYEKGNFRIFSANFFIKAEKNS